jgi:hypothetical protein
MVFYFVIVAAASTLNMFAAAIAMLATWNQQA